MSPWKRLGWGPMDYTLMALLVAFVWGMAVLFTTEPAYNCRAAEERIQAFEECRTIEGCRLSRSDVWWHVKDKRNLEEKCQ